MSEATVTQCTYQFTDFPNGKVNPTILQAQVNAGGLSQTCTGVSTSGTTATIIFAALIVAADITLLNAIVAAHTGASFSANRQFVNSEGISSLDSTTAGAKVALASGPLPAGTYNVMWYAEIAATSVIANVGAGCNCTGQVNSGTVGEFSYTTNYNTTDVSFSGAYSITINAGDQLNMTINQFRVGATSNPALIRRARIFLQQVG